MNPRERWHPEDDPEYMAEMERAMRGVNLGCVLFVVGIALLGVALVAIANFFMGFVTIFASDEAGTDDSLSVFGCEISVGLAKEDMDRREFLSACTLAQWEESSGWPGVARKWNLEPSQSDAVPAVDAICALADDSHREGMLCRQAASKLGARSVQRAR
jgi:hypothetical protein